MNEICLPIWVGIWLLILLLTLGQRSRDRWR